MAFLGTALALNPECRARRRGFVVACSIAGAATVTALLDRSSFAFAMLAVLPVLAGAARSVARDPRVRLPLVVVGCYCVFAGVAFREKAPDAGFQVARALKVAYRDPDAFIRVSLENTDRELVRFVSSRTSVHESILAPSDLSGLLLTFTGRSIVLLPGANSRAVADKHVALTRAFYGTEAALHQTCRDLDIDYVVYSIDVLLDGGRYSPRYLAAVQMLNPELLAFQMHFTPESLRYFTLQYENDHYRLFKVTDGPETIFLTDHPPVYQPALLQASGGSLEAFHQNIGMLFYNYASAMNARSRGDLDEALRRLRSCVDNAPEFTRARLALADVYMDLERYQDARDVVMTAVAYAPDNSQAMYYAAYIHARLGKFDQAKAFLKVLLTHERDPDILEKARLLQAYMDQGLPLQSTAPGP
jgi:hypothetical protein